MKTKIIDTVDKTGFKPFDVVFTAETIQNARLLFHILNCGSLWDAIKNLNGYGCTNGYSINVSQSAGNGYNEIKKIITSQGFDL